MYLTKKEDMKMIMMQKIIKNEDEVCFKIFLHIALFYFIENKRRKLLKCSTWFAILQKNLRIYFLFYL